MDANPFAEEGPPGDGLFVYSPKKRDLQVIFTNEAERDPERDAIVLSAYLATHLDEATFRILAQLVDRYAQTVDASVSN